MIKKRRYGELGEIKNGQSIYIYMFAKLLLLQKLSFIVTKINHFYNRNS
jgi:hypothetical protein